MNNPKFTAEEVKVIKSDLSSAAVATKLGRTVPSIECKRRRLGVTGTGRAVRESTVAQDLEKHDETYWLREHTALTAKYDKLLKATTVTERLVQRIASLAPLSYSPAPDIISGTSRKHEGNPQSAVLMLSDCHIGKTTSPNQTLSFGSYNFDIFMARLKFLEDAVLSISKNHVSTEVPELVIPMLGDMLDGTLTHSNESAQLDPIFTQFYAGGHALAQFLRNLAPHFPSIRIYSVVGNHCVDAETEILTKRGWLKHTQLLDSDVCLGLEKDGVTAIWQPITKIIREPQIDRMVTIENRQFSFRGTEHHRFYYFVPGHPSLNEARWSEIKKLPIQIPTAALYTGSGAGVPDAMLELCGAVLTDGSICADKSNVVVYQNPKKEAWVKEAFEKSGLAYSRRTRSRIPPKSICGRLWKGGCVTNEVSYRLSSSAAREFLRISALEKGELPDWAWDMTHTQFKRFIGAILAGDGTGTLEDSSPVLYGKSKEWLGKIQALCALHGVSGQLSSYNPNNSNPNLQFRLSLFSGKHVAVGNSARITTSEPTGEIVWCVQTNTENFYCRRKGRGYFTGNTRFQGQHRMPTKNRFSNFDSFLYAYIGALVRDIPNIKWTLDAQPYTIFEVQNSTFFGMHGDTLRGGDRALGVPNHAMGRLVSTATQLMNKYGKKAPNYYLTGHLHRSIVLPHATGSIIVNGGFPSTDEYSLAEMFTPSDSSQTFFFVHPKFGKTASYEISLKFAEVSKTPPYAIPSEFKMS